MKKNDTLGKLKIKERKLRQQIIIDSAREVFGQKTYDKASMAEIAKAAGIAKSSIYTYFKSQEELYAKIAYMDSCDFIEDLESRINHAGPGQVDKALAGENCVNICITHFLAYYIAHTAQWRMITHFALHGNRDMGAVDQLNEIGRRLMDLFELVFRKLGCDKDARILAHTLFSCLSGILISFRNYPGRTEAERIAHMTRIGDMVEAMVLSLVRKNK
ncbi:MAG: TetR/AcrR family transcriptional regulator [Desulfobacteraceae bacterium]|nr:TetR/AcrR family transcriptional regulator [Desulfobacteraceae bacterium]